jgi:hypothetical protein
MCDNRNKGKLELNGKIIRVDECLTDVIASLNSNGMQTLGSCCGHGKYSTTIIIKGDDEKIYELYTGIIIPRTARFYKSDKEKYYYIPEIK